VIVPLRVRNASAANVDGRRAADDSSDFVRGMPNRRANASVSSAAGDVTPTRTHRRLASASARLADGKIGIADASISM
jgi:hypothetical protein